MAYFKISEPNQPTKWITEVDGANGTLTFQTTREGAHCEDEGFFADSEFEYIKHHFIEAYPELEYMSIDSDWGDYGEDAPEARDMEEAAPAMAEAGVFPPLG